MNEKRTSNSVTDSSCLSRNATTYNNSSNIYCIKHIRNNEWLTNYQFKSLKSKILINISTIDSNHAATIWGYVNTRD